MSGELYSPRDLDIGLAFEANTARNLATETEDLLFSAQQINEAGIEGVEISEYSLLQLSRRRRSAAADFRSADARVPDFRTIITDNTFAANNIPAVEVPISTAELSSTHAELREQLLGKFDLGFTVYELMLSTIAEVDGAKTDCMPVDKEHARKALHGWLSPARLKVLAEQIELHKANPQSGSPDAGFDILVLPAITPSNTAKDELARHVQKALPFAGDTSLGKDYHSLLKSVATTIHPTLPIRFAAAPRHYNIPGQSAIGQIHYVRAHNGLNPGAQLAEASDFEAIAHYHVLLGEELLTTPTSKSVDRTYYRSRCGHTPTGHHFSAIFVSDRGQLIRSGSKFDNGNPARALIV